MCFAPRTQAFQTQVNALKTHLIRATCSNQAFFNNSRAGPKTGVYFLLRAVPLKAYEQDILVETQGFR